MKDKPRQEPVQTAVMSGQCRLKCLLPIDQKKILLWSTSSIPKPEKMNEDDSPFYLAVNNNLRAGSLQTKDWFKVGPIGINKLNSLMKTVAPKTGINNERL